MSDSLNYNISDETNAITFDVADSVYYIELTKTYADSAKRSAQEAINAAREADLSETNAQTHAYNAMQSANNAARSEIDDIDEFAKFTNAYTTQFTVRSNRINENDFCRAALLRKIWIPATCTIIEAPSADKSPFYGLSSALEIFTDVENSSSIPEGWGEYWNYYSATEQLPVHYGAAKSEYNAFNIN